MERPAEPESAVKIVVADDHNVMRSGLRLLLEAETGFEVVAEADTVQAVFRDVRQHRPTVLVLDLNMPGGSSVGAIWTAAGQPAR
jgi:two-component system response regulator NreC